MQYVWAFVIGGGFCVLGQLLIDFTKLTPARRTFACARWRPLHPA